MQQEWHAYLDDQDSKPMLPEEEEFLSLLEFASQAISTSSHSNTLPPLSNFHTDDRFGAGIAEKLYAVDPVKVIALPVAALSALNNPSSPSQDTLLETRGESLDLQDDQSVMRAAWGASVDSLSKFVDPPKPDWTGLMREAGILPASAVGSQDAPAGAELDVTTRDDADGSVMRFRETNGQMHLHLKSAAKNGAPVEEDTLTLNVPAGKGQANQLVKGVVSVLEQEAAARRTEVDTQDGADSSKPKPAPLPLIPNLGQMINRPQPPKWLLKNFLTEDCVACRMIWTQVERDVSDTKDEREVQDSFVHHCIDAQQSSIFYTACSEMFDDKKLMIRDYVTGRHDVKSICGRAQFCKWPKPETIENFAGPRLDGQQRKELLSKSFQGGGGYRGFFKWVRRSPHDKLKGKKSKDVDAFGLLGKVKALVGAAAKAKVVKGGGIVKMKAQKKKGGKKKGGKGGKKGGKKGGGGGKKGGGGGGKKGGGGGKGGKKGGLLKKIVKAAKKAAGALGGKGGGGGGGGKKKGGLLKKVVAAVKGMLGKKGGGGGGSAGGGGGGKKKKDGFWKKLVKAAKKLVKKIGGKKKK